MAETFYSFVEGASPADSNLAQPTTSARIAIYDDMAMVPRVVTVEPSDIRTYLDEITQTVYTLASQQCAEWSFMLIRELVENFIHASFLEPSISILDKGQTLVFSDQGPGIPNKPASLKPGWSSATADMKRYIRGVGSGLPIVEEQMRLKNGTVRIEDNLGHGTIVTVSLAHKDTTAAEIPAASAPAGAASAVQAPVPPAPAGVAGGAYPPVTPQPSYPQQPWPAQQTGYPPAGAPAPNGGWGQPYGGGACGAANPYGAPPAPQPWGAPQPAMPAQAAYGNPWGNPQPAAYDPYQAAYAAPAPGAPGTYAPSAYPGGMHGRTAVPGTPYPSAPAGSPPYPPAGTPQQAQAWGAPASAATAGEARGLTQPAGIEAHVPLTQEQKDVLHLFTVTDKLGPSELKDHLGVAQATGSRRLKDLAEAGYIAKKGQKYLLTGEGERVLTYLMNSEG